MLAKNEVGKLEDFAKSLGIEFNDISILKNSLVHRSYLNESNSDGIKHHNERLEFLGDAVLELIITEYLFLNYPNRPEGDLTSFRAATVKTESLAETAMNLEFGKYIYLSKGEELTGGRNKPYILANTYEAILGAIYLDQGYEVSKKFVHSTLVEKIPQIIEKRLDIDNKSKLQERSQEVLNITPSYEVEKEEGPDHNKTFTMRIMLGDKYFGSGKGRSKQEAEQNAAKYALENWNDLNEKSK